MATSITESTIFKINYSSDSFILTTTLIYKYNVDIELIPFEIHMFDS